MSLNYYYLHHFKKLNSFSYFKKLGFALIIVIVTGCAAISIDTEGTYPAPLVNKLPLSVGVYYSEELSSFQYIEVNENNGKDQYIINNGSSQLALFNSLLPAVFEQVTLIDDLNATADYDNLDIIFIPEIKDFQAGFPRKTRLDVYEIWIQYNMRLSEANGAYIHDWNMTAYGKAPTASYSSAKDGITEANNVALRDLAASFALGFSSIPAINDWLNNNDIL